MLFFYRICPGYITPLNVHCLTFQGLRYERDGAGKEPREESRAPPHRSNSDPAQQRTPSSRGPSPHPNYAVQRHPERPLSHPAGAPPPASPHHQPAGVNSAPASQAPVAEAVTGAPPANANNSSNSGKTSSAAAATPGGAGIEDFSKTLTAATLIDAIITHQINSNRNPQPRKSAEILKQLEPSKADSAAAAAEPQTAVDVDKVSSV